MRKEAIATFNEGLNYDLNPITTPDNVLTDCVNGTFITFNGDELALQSSLGNDVLAQLSEGFYPIGIKEYGGILYIVSAKHPEEVPELFREDSSFNKGAVVYNVENGVKHFYKSLEDNNYTELPYQENTSYWLYIGLEDDFINAFGSIEFGSFPSIVGNDPVESNEVNYSFNSEVSPLNQLYKPVLITKDFKAGKYLSFSSVGSPNLQYFSYSAYRYDSYIDDMVKYESRSKKSIYKVKLIQKVGNSFRDLTELAWKQLAMYLHANNNGEELNTNVTAPNEIKTWFSEPGFAFFNNTTYKGDLFISVELEDYGTFEVSNIKIASVSNDHIPVTIYLKINRDDSDWNPTGCPQYVDICYSALTTPNFGSTESHHFTLLNVPIQTIDGLPAVQLDIVEELEEANLNFLMRLRFSFGGVCTPVTPEELPKTFLNKHTISFSKKLTLPESSYVLIPNEEDVVLGATHKTYTSFSVVNDSGYFVDSSGNYSSTQYKYVLKDSDAHDAAVATNTLWGTYEIAEIVPYFPSPYFPINYTPTINSQFVWTYVELLKATPARILL